MRRSLLLASVALFSVTFVTHVYADQQQGAQVYTNAAFGLGKLKIQVQPSTEPGIVNGFFMLKYYQDDSTNGSWPNGWTEIDYEYVPGNHESWRRTAEGDCGTPTGNCTAGNLQGNAADYIAVNIIAGTRKGCGSPCPAGDSQVFYKLPAGYFNTPKTYIIEFNSAVVKWSAEGVNNDKPFMYQKTGASNATIHDSMGFQYLVDGVAGPRNMHIWLNVYSGLGGGWGGGVIPRSNTEMVVTTVEFYPATNCGQDSCTYSDRPSMSSDFVNGRYSLNSNQSDFGSIWVNQDFQYSPIYTKAAHATVVPGRGLVMKYVYTP